MPRTWFELTLSSTGEADAVLKQDWLLGAGRVMPQQWSHRRDHLHQLQQCFGSIDNTGGFWPCYAPGRGAQSSF
jgi:hypothetical protein